MKKLLSIILSITLMMTALSSDDQRERGERLGADRYLVKSQVGIEDVINAIYQKFD